MYKTLNIPDIFNTNISHQFDYKITFENFQHKNTNSKGDFVLKNLSYIFFFKDFWYTNRNLTHIWYKNSINTI